MPAACSIASPSRSAARSASRLCRKSPSARALWIPKAGDVAHQRGHQHGGRGLSQDGAGGVLVQHVLDLVGEHASQLLGILGAIEQPAEDGDGAARRGEGIDHRMIHHDDAERIA
jgi:hypothetical protein